MSVDTVTVAPAQEVKHSVEDATLPIVRREATVMELAAVIAGSRDFPDCRMPEKAAVRILAGKEMGVGPIASVIGIRVQNGRVSMDATLMAGCIKRSGKYDYRVAHHDNDICTLVFYEDGTAVGEVGFSMDDAKKAGLAGKDTWKNYPRNMLFARALSNGARWHCAGIFGGSVYAHEELGYAVDEEGRAVEVEGGSDLCTLEQRKEIRSLITSLGETEAAYCSRLAIKLLDELSQYEAAKEIKQLEKKLLRQGKPESATVAVAGGQAMPDSKTPLPGKPVCDSAPATAGETLTTAQQTLADAYDESRQPSTPEQRDALLGLAKWLIPDEDECVEAVKSWLAKRNCQKVADLTRLQAAGLIEALQQKLEEKKEEEKRNKQTPPFDPTPATGN